MAIENFGRWSATQLREGLFSREITILGNPTCWEMRAYLALFDLGEENPDGARVQEVQGWWRLALDPLKEAASGLGFQISTRVFKYTLIQYMIERTKRTTHEESHQTPKKRRCTPILQKTDTTKSTQVYTLSTPRPGAPSIIKSNQQSPTAFVNEMGNSSILYTTPRLYDPPAQFTNTENVTRWILGGGGHAEDMGRQEESVGTNKTGGYRSAWVKDSGEDDSVGSSGDEINDKGNSVKFGKGESVGGKGHLRYRSPWVEESGEDGSTESSQDGKAAEGDGVEFDKGGNVSTEEEERPELDDEDVCLPFATFEEL